MQEQKLELYRLKSKNNKIKSKFIHLHECNIGRERSLITFTIPKIQDSTEQLILIDKIRNFFIKRLQNLKTDIQYFTAIELGKNFNNPHLHIQLYFDKKDEERIDNAYIKTLKQFQLIQKRNKITKINSSTSTTTSLNYTIKESDNQQQTNSSILKRDKARKKIKNKDIRAKNISFYTSSRSLLPQPLYKKLWFDYGMNYHAVNELISCGYAIKYTQKDLELVNYLFRHSSIFIFYKNGAIKLNIEELYTLILLPLLLQYSDIFMSVSSQLRIYCNKREKRYILRKSFNNTINYKEYQLPFGYEKNLYHHNLIHS
jgi:hypothetical protein